MSEARQQCALLNIEVTPVDKGALIAHVGDYLGDGQQRLVLGHNLHSAYLYHTDPRLQAVYDRADVVIADGKPIEFDARRSMRAAGLDETVCERLGSTDWIEDFVTAKQPASIAVVGANVEANQKFVELLQGLAPESDVRGFAGAGWNPAREKEVTEELNQIQPELVFIGLGMPLQEQFVARKLDRLPPAVYVLIGGAIDQLTGTQVLAPRWVGRFGLEWAWRLAAHPRRLAHRYLVEPWALLGIRVRQGLRGKKRA